MANSKTLIRKTILVLLCIIMVYCCADVSFLGPGIRAETVMESISATDVVTPIGGEVQPMATSATQVKNVLTRITVKHDDIKSATFVVEGDTSAQLHKYNRGSITEQQLYDGFWELWDNYREAGFIISSRKYNINTHLLDMFFNIPSTESEPLNTIAFQEGSVFDSAGDVLQGVFEYIEVLMGDVNQDGIINANDTLKILQFNNGSVTLTNEQQLAADVNRDGVVDDNDSSIIQNYAVANISSFWDNDQVVLPTEPNDEVVHQGWYRIKNAQTGQYIMGGNTQATKYQATVGTVDTTTQSYLKFRISQVKSNGAATGYYSLRCQSDPNDTLYLKLDSDYELTLSYTQGEYITYSGHWYLLPQSDGSFRMVNRAVPKRALTDFGYADATNPKCMAGYCEPGSYWVLEPVIPTANIKYYYDMCYYARKGSASVSSLQVYQDDVQDIFSGVFGLTVTTGVPRLMQSYNDMCYSSINATNVEEWCTHDEEKSATENNNACAQYCISPPIDEETNEIVIPASGKLHHNNSSANLDHLYQTKQADTPVDIQLLTSGHGACGDEVDGTAHEYNNVGGVAYIGYRVAVVFNPNISSGNYKQLTTLHELSHCFGAGSAEGSVADTESDSHRQCVMAYGRDDNYLLSAWEDYNYNNLYCSSCRTEMKRYIMLNF